jgi:hypothetical protein
MTIMHRTNFRNSRTDHEANAMLSSSIPRCCLFVANKPLGNTSYTTTTLHNIGTYMHSARSDPPAITQTLGYTPARDNHKIYIPPSPPPYLPKHSPHIPSRGRERRTDYTCLGLVAQMFENFRVMPKGALRPTKFGSCGRGNAGSSRKRKAHTGK